MALHQFTSLVNDPKIKEGATTVEDAKTMAMMAEVLGGPSGEEQASQRATAAPPTPTSSPVSSNAPAAQTAAITSPASTPIAFSGNLVFFTGKSGAGKSWLAEKMGAKVIELTSILDSLTGGHPVAADLLSRLMAWSNGEYNAAFPNTLERVAFSLAVRLSGYPEFGHPGFLVKQAISQAAGNDLVAITDVRTIPEFEALKAAGFKHYHVCASQTTMQSRVHKQVDEKLALHLDGQASTRIQQSLEGEKMPVVWSDPIVAPPSPRFHTPEEFLSLFLTSHEALAVNL